LIKDNELDVHYQPKKANVIVDTMSRKAHCNYLLAVRLTGEDSSTRVLPNQSLFNITLTPTLRDEIKAARKNDEGMGHIKRRMQEGVLKVTCFHKDVEGTIWLKERLVVPKKEALKKKILYEAHMSRYSIHPRSTNHMKPGGLLQPLSIPEWKWNDISTDFIVGLPLMAYKFYSIWVIMDRLSKSAHFIPIHTNYSVQKYAGIYIARVLCLHGVPKMVISHRGSQFVTFFEQLHVPLGTHLIHSLAYHPETDGQTKRVNQILKDMLRDCVLEHQGSRDQNLHWVEFSYNNSYQESLKMAPFKVLYRCRCRTPLNWIEPGDKVIFGPDLVKEAEATIRRIQDNLKDAKSRQETYANKKRQTLEFEVGDHVYLRVSPMKGVKRFGVKGKLAPHYI
jgi:hypothetical protein